MEFGADRERIAGPGFAQTGQIVADQQGSAAFAKVPDLAGFVFSGAHTALQMRHFIFGHVC